MPALTPLQQRLAPLGLPFAPSDAAMRVDLSGQELQMLILAGLKAVAQGGGSTERTATGTTATGNGSVAAGAKSVEFIFSSDFAGTVLGMTFSGAADASYSLPYLPGGDTYPAIAYTIDAGSARITTVA